jgi:hypothetical protein
MNRRLNDIKMQLGDLIEKMKNLPKIKRHMTQLNKRNRCNLVNSIAENEMGIDLFIQHSIHKKKNVLPSDYVKHIKLIKNRPDLNKFIILLNNKIDNLDDSFFNSKTYKDIYSFLNDIKLINRYLNKIKSLLNDETENSGGGMDKIESDLLKSIEFNNQIIGLLDKVSSDLKKISQIPQTHSQSSPSPKYCFPKCFIHKDRWIGSSNHCMNSDDINKEEVAREIFNKTESTKPGNMPLNEKNEFLAHIDPSLIC